MREPTACAGMRPDAEASVDPRVEINTLLDDLPDQFNQALLDYLKELLRTLPPTLSFLSLFGLGLPL